MKRLGIMSISRHHSLRTVDHVVFALKYPVVVKLCFRIIANVTSLKYILSYDVKIISLNSRTVTHSPHCSHTMFS